MAEKKTVLLFFLLFCVCGFSFAQQAVTIDTAVQMASDYLTVNLPRNHKVAILNIESDTPKISEYVMEELSALLVNDRSLVVVDRRDLDLIRQEERFQMSGTVFTWGQGPGFPSVFMRTAAGWRTGRSIPHKL
jgi:hypothetical protein